MVASDQAPERTILTGVGPLRPARPRVDERKARGAKEYYPFSSMIRRRFLRRTPALEGALATLYLKGISTNDFPVSLEAILREKALVLSASTISRSKAVWEREYETWRKRLHS